MPDYKSKNNQWLRVAEGVSLTEAIDPVICALDKFFQQAGKVRYVISGLRLKIDQMRILRAYADNSGLAPDYGDFDADKKNEIGQYVWQYDWSRLLAMGYLINPPNRAEILVEYLKDRHQQKGRIVEPSSHFNGTAFDISGSQGEQTPSEADHVDDEVEIIKTARAQEPGIGIKSITIERKNNCLHINV